MLSDSLSNNESGRLEALHRYNILDTPAADKFDRITALAAHLFKAPVALVSLVDESRVWFKSCYGTEQRQMPREGSICSHALTSGQILVVPDLASDPRFADLSLVRTGTRFYAGAPLTNHEGFTLGTLCVLDTQPRHDFDDDQRRVLRDLAALVMDEFDLHLAAQRVTEIDRALLAVTRGVATEIGDAFFPALVQHLAQTLGVDYAYIGLISGDAQDTVKTLALCAQGQLIDNIEYPLPHSPCHEVIQERDLCCHPSGVRAQFPKAAMMSAFGIESYGAMPFFDAQDKVMGVLGIMHRQPLVNVQLVAALLPIFALRIATELDRQHTDSARQQLQRDLSHLVAQRTAQLSETNQRLQQEVAERQNTEIALKKERETLRVLLDNVQAGIVACDGKGRLTLFNKVARKFHNLPPQPLPPDQWADHYDLYLPDGKTPMPKEAIPLFRALQGERVDDAEMVIAPKGGPARTLVASGQAIVALDGTCQGAVVVMHDISDRKQMETALKDSEARLTSIFETIPSGVVILNRQGQIEIANSAAEKILRLTRHQLSERVYNDPSWEITTVDGQPFAEADLPFVQVLRTGEPVHEVEHAITHDDGSQTILCINASPLYSATGELTSIVTSISDITQKKQAEITLQASEERYRSVLETVAEGIVLQQADGSIFTCNASAEQILGLTADQMMGRTSLDPCWSAIHEDGTPFEGNQHPAIVTLRTGEPQSNVVMGVHKPDGTLSWISINTRPLRHPQDPTPFAVVTSFFNITDRKQAEAERTQLIHEQTARLEAEANQFRSAFLVEISTILAASLNQSHTLEQVANLVVPFFADWCAIDLLRPRSIERVAIAHCDPAKVELGWQLDRQYPQSIDAPEGVPKVLRTGRTEMIVGIPTAALEKVAQDPEHLRQLQNLGLKSCIVTPLIARGKTLGAISFVTAESDRPYSAAHLALAENIAHQIAIALDNAQLYQAEQTARSEAEAANRIKDEFLAVLSHELRSPLNPILGWSQLLQQRLTDIDILARGLETIERNAKLQTQLIADLLDVSRILQGKLHLEMAPVNLKTVLESALETVRLAAEAKHIHLYTEWDGAGAFVLGDAGRLQQVVWNLLSNAVKFTTAGGRVYIRLELVDTQATVPGVVPQAQITVTDTGQGVDSEFLPYIFERFRQADSKTTRQFGGLGLGLAIARQLVELHGGTIAATSSGTGQGTMFTVQLPLQRAWVKASGYPASVPSALAKTPQPTLTGLRILVVEDEADARELLALVLEQAGATVTTVTSATAALEMLPDLNLDLLISDIAMPDMDGYMLLQAIRSQTTPLGQGLTFKAIALTAYAGETDRQRALAAGFHDHLSKPFEADELVAAIATLVHTNSP